MIALAALLATASPLCAQTRVFDLTTVSQVAEVPLMLKERADGHIIELRNIDPQNAAALDIVGASGEAFQSLQAQARPNGIVLPSTAAGSFTLIVRAQASDTLYVADVWLDGALLKSKIRFSGGTALTIPRLGVGEEIVGVARPNGPTEHVAYLMSADGANVLARDKGPVTHLRRREAGDTVVMFGALSEKTGAIRVYRNDFANDTDGDGLGDALENVLGICASRRASAPGINCALTADTRDTDGDGLWDSWEVMGVNGQALPAWGADPRHKDIFVEVDFRRLTLADNQSGLALRMTPAVARQMASIYADSATTDAATRATHAQDVGNPDGQPGVSLHLDIGVPPETPADATTYGDWGGYTAVDAVPDGQGGYMPQPPAAAMASNMDTARRGLFHYVLGYTTGGGSCGTGIACGFNMNSAGNSAHEFGHTLFLDHNGPSGTHEPNCKPNYPSLMNYAFLDTGVLMFSDGQTLPTLNNHSLVETGIVSPGNTPFLTTLKSKFRYKVDAATGSVDWNRDGTFAPANAPVRAYANLLPGNSGGCEFTREGEQLVGAKSQRSPAVVRYYDHIWVFAVTLDNKLDYTYTMHTWGCSNIDDCPTPDFSPHGIQDIGPIDGVDVAVIRVNGKPLILIVAIRPDGSLVETWMHQEGGLNVWESTVTIPASPAAGEPSLAVSRDGTSVALAYRGTDNIVRFRWRGAASWGPEQEVLVAGQPVSMHPQTSPGLAFTGLPIGIAIGSEEIVGAFADSNGDIQLYTPASFPHHQGWVRLSIPYEPMHSAIGRPSMAWTGGPMTNAPAADRTLTPGMVATGAEASLEVPSTTYGRFYIVYISANPPVTGATNPNPVRMQMTYVDDTGRLRIGLDSFFDNVWSYAFGIDLLQPGEVGLHAAETYSIPNAGAHPDSLYQVSFRPHADGISNLSYSNKNDWPVIAWASCSVLAGTQNASMHVSCPPKPW
ncbi:hypothetical protein WN72_35960 [Bradyrhizobium arachidis]|uniref:Uncharacterized protein n=1 Tax=Bradyrhizobium arachidis TaxID=858423 RepID=A0AAE7NTL7_9BRAD|nr:hypothetical protein WN72_35960 [Bradyrhizobium arachidis]